MRLATLVYNPAVEPIGTVIWMHGLGATFHDFVPVLPHLELPDVRFVFPQAPSIPVTLNAGYVMPAWYDIRTLEEGPQREDPAGILASANQIRQLIEAEAAAGVPPERVVLAGFSQGGAMALYAGLRHPERLAGICVLSGYLLLPDRLDAERHGAQDDTPKLFCHGRSDEVVPMARGRAAYARVAATGSCTWQDYGMGHEVCASEIGHIRDWLGNLGLRSTARGPGGIAP